MKKLTNNGSRTNNLSLTENMLSFHFCVFVQLFYANRYVHSKQSYRRSHELVPVNYFGTSNNIQFDVLKSIKLI